MPRSRRRKDAPPRLREQQQTHKAQRRAIHAQRVKLSAEIQDAWDEALVIDAHKRFEKKET